MKYPYMKRLAVLVLLAVFAFVLAGCWNPFAPNKGGGGGGGNEQYKERTSPENVLYNIKTAYEYMNAREYLDCLSEDFTFYPSEEDVNEPGSTIPPEWYKADETIIHNAMFAETSDVDYITLTLTMSDTLHDAGNPSDPSDDVWIYVEDVDLRLAQIGDVIKSATTPSEFRLRIDVDQVGPNGETLYEIFKWYDLGRVARDSGSHDPGEENMSLGQLKASFAD